MRTQTLTSKSPAKGAGVFRRSLMNRLLGALSKNVAIFSLAQLTACDGDETVLTASSKSLTRESILPDSRAFSRDEKLMTIVISGLSGKSSEQRTLHRGATLKGLLELLSSEKSLPGLKGFWVVTRKVAGIDQFVLRAQFRRNRETGERELRERGASERDSSDPNEFVLKDRDKVVFVQHVF